MEFRWEWGGGSSVKGGIEAGRRFVWSSREMLPSGSAEGAPESAQLVVVVGEVC